MAVGIEPIWDVAQPPSLPMKRFTVKEYHHLIDVGVFAQGEPFELLEGWIVAKMPRKPPHDMTIELISGALGGALPAGWRFRIQSAITTADSEPEPDLVLVRGAIRDYANHHPGPDEIALVVEVSDATLDRDRDFKGRLYARAGLPVYWLVNLVEGRIEVYTDPTGPEPNPHYRARQDFGPGDFLTLIVEGRMVARVDARELLP